MDAHDVKAQFTEAAADAAGLASREVLARTLTASFRDAGELLWVGGYMLGTDRRDQVSPFGYGDDATVGLATVLQIAGELTSGAVALLEAEKVYAAAALIRQLVEVEYLCWAFAEEPVEATDWMRSSREERLARWQPRYLRAKSGGRFRGSDYAGHCERGGHPTPLATGLLPGHEQVDPVSLWWVDLVSHAVSSWDYAIAAARGLALDYSVELSAIAAKHSLPAAIDHWRQSDQVLRLASTLLFGATDSAS